MYAYAKSLSFPSMQNPTRGTIFLCLYLHKIGVSKRNCRLNNRESNSLLTASNWPLGRNPWYIISIFPTPMALSTEKQLVASRSSSNHIVEVSLSISIEICGCNQNIIIKSNNQSLLWPVLSNSRYSATTTTIWTNHCYSTIRCLVQSIVNYLAVAL
jgi:hypothetical protein